MNEKRTLLEKYSIPIERLDFDYIKTSQNTNELEKIIEILKSGEEGFYPDLTKFAEDRLKELDPGNCMLRKEVNCIRTSIKERQEINKFMEEIRSKEKKIRNQTRINDRLIDSSQPPVRSSNGTSGTEQSSEITKPKRIAASDYAQWDRFDADVECLKMDLHEEQMCEKALAEEKRRQNSKKLIEILPETFLHDQMSDIEKEELADKHRIKGNEFFKCAELQQAISEYTTSLAYAKTAAAFNNRALVYLKLKMYKEAVRDCDDCLHLDATNIKAMLRKSDALIANGCKNEAYKQYTNILSIDPDNEIAKKSLQNISLRLKIEDVNVQPKVKKSTKSQFLEFDENNDAFEKKLIIPLQT